MSIVGARPQFIKAAPVEKELRKAGYQVALVHTGQHYDYGMSKVFFEEMGIPEPDANLEVGSGSHGRQTGLMLMRLDEFLGQQRPDWVLVYGDTNSTLAGALAAAKLHLRVAHVESGLRSFNRAMPEELNRVVTDHLSTLLLCPSQTAIDNLAAEGITRSAHLVGDVMYDAVLQFAEVALKRSSILNDLQLEPKSYLLATVHRAENTDSLHRLENILAAFVEVGEPVILPVHPRLRRALARSDQFSADGQSLIHNGSLQMNNVLLIDPIGYLDMLNLERHARMILTDSGGMQKEAYWFGVPCVTLRDETEWVETVQSGWNLLVGADAKCIVAAVRSFEPEGEAVKQHLYGEPLASERCVRLLES